ncbi:MAG: tRNA (adenosine(37)-N6)-threonylcarbamoyltransferase complex dimerization subunit type 1 TsaB [Ruminococcus callidus]
MRILGIDTSGKVAAAALYDSEAGCLLAQQSVYTKRTHSQVILPLAERLLADTGLQWQDVDGFAVAKGPGSYTGLRIGIAAVKAMAYALQIPCVGISRWRDWRGRICRGRALICSVMTARQALVYAGLYRSDGTTVTALRPDGMQPVAELSEQLAALGEPVLLVGDAVEEIPAAAFLHAASPATNCKTVPASVWQQHRRHGRHRRTVSGIFAAGQGGKGLAGKAKGKVTLCTRKSIFKNVLI